MAKVDDWLGGIPSTQTQKNYKNGLRKFEEYFGKGMETLIGFEEAGRVVEEFFRQNSRIIDCTYEKGCKIVRLALNSVIVMVY